MPISPKTLDKAIDAYYATLASLHDQHVTRESGIRRAFETLLSTLGHDLGWTLIAEETIANRKRPDATLRDANTLPRGYWEAKDSSDDLETEIVKKIRLGYPITNTIFEDSLTGILYQNGKRIFSANLHNRRALADMLMEFFTHSEPEYERFEQAIGEFKDRIPELAKGLLDKITQERASKNKAFITAYDSFKDVCQVSIDPQISDAQIDEMLVQHLLTERLFRTVFDNQDFTHRNAIAIEIEKVIQALTARSFNRGEFQSSLDRFYVAIEGAASTITDYSEKQGFLNTVYERFFQGFARDQADTHGIVYTPQPIVDFMCASVEEVLQREFGRSISDRGVQILDPCTGTGNFVVNLIRRIAPQHLEYKYQHDLFANEIMLLPYYIASMNIEHAYYERTGQYQPFEGICFVDTLSLAEGPQLSMFTERNTERVEHEKDAQIMVIIGNPPYNVGQANENDNNKNRKYPVIDERVRSTYAKDSRATNKNALSDAYVKFFRWATDRLNGRDGIVCYVSNNSFASKLAFDGMRKHLMHDFTHIWHVDLGGDAREQGGGNVFNIMVSVGITIAVRSSHNADHGLWYYQVPDDWKPIQKLNFLSEVRSVQDVDWQELFPDDQNTWLTEGLQKDYHSFIPIGSKEVKKSKPGTNQAIFKLYSRGVETTRDDWMYDFQLDALTKKSSLMIETYSAEVSRWVRAGCPSNIDDFVLYDDTKIKWSSRLKECLSRKQDTTFDSSHIRNALYRPFSKQYLYFDSVMTHRQGMQPSIFPTPATEQENSAICVPGPGNRKGFGTLISSVIPDLELGFEKTQCFPYYTYAEDGTNRQENITDWALEQFRAAYGANVTKWDIFYYVYAVLHHPQYRERYAKNLKYALPHIPLIGKPPLQEQDGPALFKLLSDAGKRLAEIHIKYEQQSAYPLKEVITQDIPFTWYVTKMTLTPDKSALIVNESIRLEGIPQECYGYRLGNRSALEWVIDQYQVYTDKRSTITTDPNRDDDPEYIVRLVKQVITVSVETMKIVASLPDLGLPE